MVGMKNLSISKGDTMYIEKMKRIEELEKLGFNTPRMFVVKRGSLEKSLVKLKKFIEGADIVNIRTYDIINKQDGYSRPHITNLHFSVVIENIAKLNDKYICMVDLERPGDGEYSGNIEIHKDYTWNMDYCVGPGAVVRNANLSIYGEDEKYYNAIGDVRRRILPFELKEIVHIAFSKFARRQAILEWSYQSNPCGKLQEHTIFWEYRDEKI